MSKSRPSIYLNYLLVLRYRHPPRSLSEYGRRASSGRDQCQPGRVMAVMSISIDKRDNSTTNAVPYSLVPTV